MRKQKRSYAIGRRFKRTGARGKMLLSKPRFYKGVYEKHAYRRYMTDVVMQNTWGGSPAVADVVFNVNGGIQGKSYLSMNLGNLIGDVNNTSQIGGSLGFQLNNLPNVIDFETLYDKYKISGIKIVIQPLSNFASTANLGTLPVLNWAYDQDDLAIPAGLDTIRQYGNCKTAILNKPVKIYLKPKILTKVNAGSGGTGDLVSVPKYLDLSDPGVPHFGIKFWITNMLLGNTANINSLFRITAKYYFTCSGTR